MRKLIPILFLLAGCAKENTQVRKGGLVQDDPATVKLVPFVGHEQDKGKPLPKSTFLITPTPRNQGNEGACVPFATAYSARSIEQYYRTKATSYSNDVNIFSPEYVYNQTKIAEDCGAGTAITLTLDFMKNKGVCTWSNMPYLDNECSTIGNALQDLDAANYKILSYSKMLNTDKVGIKKMLLAKHPVMISLTIDDNFTNATAGFIWKSFGIANIGHAVTIVGYDDAKNAYKIMNSWGTGWGDGGFTYIDYDFFPTVSGFYVYVINYL